MNALVPLNVFDNLNKYIDAGAKEFYMGFHDKNWNDKFGKFADINRLTGFGDSANPYTLDELCKFINKTKQKKIDMFITFNSSIYSKNQIKEIKKYFLALKDSGISGVIVSCIELIHLSKEYDIPCVVSTIAGVYNEDIVRFYKSLGVKRIILPRDLNIDEIYSITKAIPNMEYEVFMMRNGCAYSDSFCLGMHRSEMCSVCCTIAQSQKQFYLHDDTFNNRHDFELNNQIFCNNFHTEACGLCAIYDFVKAGIKAGKIVGRSDDSGVITRDIAIMTKNIAIAKKCSSREEYLENMIFPENREYICKQGLNCYYPSIRF